MPYHGLLDWRLALDMTNLAYLNRSESTAPLTDIINLSDYWESKLDGMAQRFCDAFTDYEVCQFGTLQGVRSKKDKKDGFAIIHPLWELNAPMVVGAKREAQRIGVREFGVVDIFEVDRRPAKVRAKKVGIW